MADATSLAAASLSQPSFTSSSPLFHLDSPATLASSTYLSPLFCCHQGWVNPTTLACPGTPPNELANVSFNHPSQLGSFVQTHRCGHLRPAVCYQQAAWAHLCPHTSCRHLVIPLLLARRGHYVPCPAPHGWQAHGRMGSTSRPSLNCFSLQRHWQLLADSAIRSRGFVRERDCCSRQPVGAGPGVLRMSGQSLRTHARHAAMLRQGRGRASLDAQHCMQHDMSLTSRRAALGLDQLAGGAHKGWRRRGAGVVLLFAAGGLVTCWWQRNKHEATCRPLTLFMCGPSDTCGFHGPFPEHHIPIGAVHSSIHVWS